MMKSVKGVFYAVGLVGIVAALITAAGCSTHTAALDQARASYQQASANPTVTSNAPATLRQAQDSLNKAEAAGNDREQEHWAYMSQKQTQQAVSEANEKAAQQRITQLSEERDQAILQSREQQAAQATAEAQSKAREAQMAREEAARAGGEAQMAAAQASLAQDQVRQLQTQMADMMAKQNERGGVSLTMGDIMFRPRSVTLTPEATTDINRLADILLQNPNEQVRIEGYTDNVGSASANQLLSEERANTVREALISRGVSPDRISAQGFGGRYPVASNETESGRQQTGGWRSS
jgi:outer membrane protein OmpA-like peptidoglycan-associated protein